MAPSRKKRALRAFGLPLGILAAALVLSYTLRPRCPILHVTGLYCPGCGGQRMVWAFFRGDFAGAFHYNPFLFVLTPLLLGYGLWEAVQYVRGKPALARRKGVRIALSAVAAAALVFMILRNLPGLAFLRP